MEVNIFEEDFESVELFDKPALFTNSRIDHKTVPDGVYVYDLRHSDDGNLVTVEPHVRVNHGGTIVLTEPLNFEKEPHGNDKYITLDDDNRLNFFGTSQMFNEFIKENGLLLKTVPTQKYYEINEQAARRAKEANSFRDYTPGSATSEYQSMVDKAIKLGERQKERVDPMYHEKIDHLIDLYARKLAANFNERNVIDARVPSILITGGGNFPVHRKEKQNMARDRNMGEYQDIQGILDKVRSTGMGGISADDSMAVEKLQSKLDGLKASQENMKAVNAYYRAHKTLDGCPHLSEDEINQLKAAMARDWRKDAPPFPSYHLSNNSATIRATQQRIDDLKNRSEYAGWTFDGGRAEVNEAENRLQLLFDEKPSEEQRSALKKNGFKWAPSQGAWQRQLTKNAIHSAGYIDFIKPDNGKTPYQLQPFARKSHEQSL